MGMYDHVLLEKPIKCRCGNKISIFQTKDLGNLMDEYTFTKDNTLEKQLYRFEENPKYEKAKKEGKLAALLQKILTGKSVLNFTDTIHFYTDCDKCHNWIDITAVIVNGKVRPFKVEIQK